MSRRLDNDVVGRIQAFALEMRGERAPDSVVMSREMRRRRARRR